MPKLVSQSRISMDWNDSNHLVVTRKKPKARAPGYHLSGIIRAKLKADGNLNVDDIDDEMPLRVALGVAWEQWVVGFWPGMTWQPKPLSLDGIAGSPDGHSDITLCMDCGTPETAHMKEYMLECPCGGRSRTVPVVEEFKLTWKSAFTHPIMQEKIWLWQGAGYCYMMTSNYCRFHINWVNGDYRPPSPIYMTYLVYYPEQELEDYWHRVILPNRVLAEME